MTRAGCQVDHGTRAVSPILLIASSNINGLRIQTSDTQANSTMTHFCQSR